MRGDIPRDDFSQESHEVDDIVYYASLSKTGEAPARLLRRIKDAAFERGRQFERGQRRKRRGTRPNPSS